MTTLLLTIIGISIAAGSALMVVWYGGGAFDDTKIQAEASRLTVEGSQVEDAVSAYTYQEAKTPGSVNKVDPFVPLIDGKYLQQKPPGSDGSSGGWQIDYTNNMIRADMGASDDVYAHRVCAAARAQQHVINPTQVYACDGSDYPAQHPIGSLPENEPCCIFKNSTIVSSGGGSTGGSSGGTVTPPKTDEENVIQALRQTVAAIGTYANTNTAEPATPSGVVTAGILSSLPSAGTAGTVADNYLAFVRTYNDYQHFENVVHIPVTQTVCLAVNTKLGNGLVVLPGDVLGNFPTPDIGCIYADKINIQHTNTYEAYAYVNAVVLPIKVAKLQAAFASVLTSIGAYSNQYGGQPISLTSLGTLPSLGVLGAFPTDYLTLYRSYDDRGAGISGQAIHLTVDYVTCKALNGGTLDTVNPPFPSTPTGCFSNGARDNAVYTYYAYIDGATANKANFIIASLNQAVKGVVDYATATGNTPADLNAVVANGNLASIPSAGPVFGPLNSSFNTTDFFRSYNDRGAGLAATAIQVLVDASTCLQINQIAAGTSILNGFPASEVGCWQTGGAWWDPVLKFHAYAYVDRAITAISTQKIISVINQSIGMVGSYASANGMEPAPAVFATFALPTYNGSPMAAYVGYQRSGYVAQELAIHLLVSKSDCIAVNQAINNDSNIEQYPKWDKGCMDYGGNGNYQIYAFINPVISAAKVAAYRSVLDSTNVLLAGYRTAHGSLPPTVGTLVSSGFTASLPKSGLVGPVFDDLYNMQRGGGYPVERSTYIKVDQASCILFNTVVNSDPNVEQYPKWDKGCTDWGGQQNNFLIYSYAE